MMPKEPKYYRAKTMCLERILQGSVKLRGRLPRLTWR